MLDDIILNIDDYVKSLNVKYFYCGSLSLYLNGITEIKTFDDIDIDFYELSGDDLEMLPISIVNGYPVDKLQKLNSIEQKFHEITFHDRKIYISDLDYELETKEYLLSLPNYIFKEKASRERDLIINFINKS